MLTHMCKAIFLLLERKGKWDGAVDMRVLLLNWSAFYRFHDLYLTMAWKPAAAVVRQLFQEPVSPRLAKG